MRAGLKRIVAAAGVSLVAACAFPALAGAHAVLSHTTPHQNSSVTEVPPAVQLDFNEPVEISVGAVRVFDQRGERVDAGTPNHVRGKPSSIQIGLRGGLGRGVYTTTYRVVSADGHPVVGGFAFGVGVPATGGRGTPQVADLLARSAGGTATEGLYGAVRGLHYAVLLLLIGAVAFRLFVWPDGTVRAWPRRTLLGTAVIGLLTALAGVALQGVLAAGVGLTHALDGAVLDGALSTRTGETWLVRSGIWLFVLLFLATARGLPSRREAYALALPTALLIATLPYGGHAATQDPRALLIPADVLHVAAAGAWLGGLVLLVTVFWLRREQTDIADAAVATTRFSRLALPAILVLVLAGTAQAWFHLGSVSAFFHTTYGWALLTKIVLMASIIAVAAGNRRRTRGLPATAAALRRAMRAEILLGLLVLAATATLVRAAPPATQDSGPVLRELQLGPMQAQLDIEPAVVGRNDIHIYLFDRRTGAQIRRVEEVTLRLTEHDRGIGPITLDIPRKGPAHYELLDTPLGVAGRWNATLTVRVNDFDSYEAKTTFKIRPK